MKIFITILALVFTPISVITVHAKEQGQVTQPASGSALRKAVLDGLRPSIEADIKQKVIFIVDKIRVSDDWAFVQVTPVQPDSKSIDFRKTKYKERMDEGVFDGATTWALLRKKDNQWVVLTFQIGPTDVCWAEWDKAPYNCPRKILPYGDKYKITRNTHRTTMTPIDYENLWAAVVDMPSHRDRYSVHGQDHWKRVERNGCVLTARTGAKIDVVRLFSLFHDSRRENEGWDPDHGKRGAELAMAMRGTFFDLTDEDFDLLHYACVWHTDSDRHADPTIGTCWDADRLDLGRVGMIPDPAYMSTDFGAEIATHGVIQPWLHLAGAYLENPMTHHYYR